MGSTATPRASPRAVRAKSYAFFDLPYSGARTAASDDGSPLDDANEFLDSITRDHNDGVDYVDAMAA